MFTKFPIIEFNKEAKYKVIALEAENNKLKDELIESLNERVIDLQITVKELRKLAEKEEEIVSDGRYAGVMDESIGKVRPKIRTVTEVATLLERKSLDRKKASSAEEVIASE